MKNQRLVKWPAARPLSPLPALPLAVLLLSTLLHAAGSAPRALPGAAGPSDGTAVFNVRDYGATGRKLDFAGQAIQKAVEACAAAGGGMVYVPPGDYTSGTIHLRSHVRFFIEGGATLHSIKDKAAFDKDALFFGEDLDNVTLEGRGTVDGQAAYEHRPTGDFHDDFIYPNQVEMEKLGLPLVRSFPEAGPIRQARPPRPLPGRPHHRAVVRRFALLDDPSLRLRAAGHRRGVYPLEPQGRRLGRRHRPRRLPRPADRQLARSRRAMTPSSSIR